MNKDKYFTYLKQYHQWINANKEIALRELAEREEYAKTMQRYNMAFLEHMSQEEVYNLLSPLWAMGYGHVGE